MIDRKKENMNSDNKQNKSSLLKVFLIALLAVAIFVGLYFTYNYLAQSNVDKAQSGQTLQPESSAAETEKTADSQNSSETGTASASTAADYTAPEITITDPDGNALKLADFKGKTVVLNFWASWCPPCKAEFPDFQKFYDENKANDDIAMVLVNLIGSNGETKANAEAFIKDNAYTVPYYFDVEGQSAAAYQVAFIPTTYIITPDGELYYRNEGIMSYDKLVEMTKKAGE